MSTFTPSLGFGLGFEITDKLNLKNVVKDICESGDEFDFQLVLQETDGKIAKQEIDWDDCLYAAVRSGSLEIVRQIILRQQTTNSAIEKAFGIACSLKKIEIAKFLLELIKDLVFSSQQQMNLPGTPQFINFNQYQNKSFNGHYLFQYACESGSVFLVNEIESDPNLRVPHAPNFDYNMGLLNASGGGEIETARLMIDKGATNFAKSLELACSNGGSVAVVKLLLSLPISDQGLYASLMQVLRNTKECNMEILDQLLEATKTRESFWDDVRRDYPTGNIFTSAVTLGHTNIIRALISGKYDQYGLTLGSLSNSDVVWDYKSIAVLLDHQLPQYLILAVVPRKCHDRIETVATARIAKRLISFVHLKNHFPPELAFLILDFISYE